MLRQVFQSRLSSLKPNMLNYALMLTSSKDMARQLLEDASATAVDLSAYVSEQDDFKGWFKSVMHDVFMNRYMRRVGTSRQRQHTLSREYTAVTLADRSSQPEDSHPASRIDQVISNLAEGYRTIATMYFTGSTLPEIERATGLSSATVKTRLAYCRIQLRMHLSA